MSQEASALAELTKLVTSLHNRLEKLTDENKQLVQDLASKPTKDLASQSSGNKKPLFTISPEQVERLSEEDRIEALSQAGVTGAHAIVALWKTGKIHLIKKYSGLEEG